jgi:hypothetical protein
MFDASYMAIAFWAVHASHIHEGGRLPWLLALKRLDDEMGTGCFACARIVAARYVDEVLATENHPAVDYSAELEHLRELWSVASDTRQ